jgi:hypothetical protein
MSRLRPTVQQSNDSGTNNRRSRTVSAHLRGLDGGRGSGAERTLCFRRVDRLGNQSQRGSTALRLPSRRARETAVLRLLTDPTESVRPQLPRRAFCVRARTTRWSCSPSDGTLPTTRRVGGGSRPNSASPTAPAGFRRREGALSSGLPTMTTSEMARWIVRSRVGWWIVLEFNRPFGRSPFSGCRSRGQSKYFLASAAARRRRSQ